RHAAVPRGAALTTHQTRTRHAQDRQQETSMNWDRIEGNWKQFKGSAKEKWGKLTDDQLDVIAGKRDSLLGRIQETYGITKEETEKQLSEWQKLMREPK